MIYQSGSMLSINEVKGKLINLIKSMYYFKSSVNTSFIYTNFSGRPFFLGEAISLK